MRYSVSTRALAAATYLAIVNFALAPAWAQVVEVPTFQAANPLYSEFLQQGGVAIAPDGSVVVVWEESGSKHRAVTAHFAANGTPLGTPVRIDTGLGAGYPVIAPTAAGGFVVVYMTDDFPRTLRSRFLDATGAPVGTDLEALCDDGASTAIRPFAIATLPTGFALVYYNSSLPNQGARLCLFDALGFPRGASQELGSFGATPSDVAARADGGFVAAWTINDGSMARIFDASGLPASDPFPILDGAAVQTLAVSPTGGFAAVGVVYDSMEDTSDIWAQRFSEAGMALEAPFQVHAGSPGSPYGEAEAEFDWGGNLYVIWGESPAPFGQGPRVRGYDPSGAPLGPAVTVSTQRASRIDAVRLASGSFFNVWPYDHRLWANVVSLCTPAISTCGDGVIVPQCELCDDGAGNSDTTPDACRTDCRSARCGDAVIDGGETCDDGNAVSCDGCSATCQTEVGLGCGDGVLAVGCAETCDDGGTAAGDGCSATCTLERIPGTGAPSTDCFSEWSVDNPTNLPFLDKRGQINWTQTCVDNDARCDADGGATGSCTFRVRVCANNTDVSSCVAPTRLARWTLTGPSAAQAEHKPALAAVRSALATVPGTVVGPAERNLCTDFLAVPVPLRTSGSGPKPGKLKLKVVADDYAGGRDKDQLRLVCVP